jgi:prevent-host-death family protein
MEEISISEFRTRCRTLLDQVRKTTKPIRVTRFGKPVAKAVPTWPSHKAVEWLGSIANAIKILGDIVSPVIEESDWAAI